MPTRYDRTDARAVVLVDQDSQLFGTAENPLNGGGGTDMQRFDRDPTRAVVLTDNDGDLFGTADNPLVTSDTAGTGERTRYEREQGRAIVLVDADGYLLGTQDNPLVMNGGSGASRKASPQLGNQLFGVNVFGNVNFAGSTNWATREGIAYYLSKGLNVIRLCTRWENFEPIPGEGLTNTANLASLDAIIRQVTRSGAYVIIDIHQSWMFQDVLYQKPPVLIGSGAAGAPTAAQYANFYANIAGLYKNNPRVIFNIMNEPHDMAMALVVSNTNAAIAAIRATGATNMIMVDGNKYTPAIGWTTAAESDGVTNAVGMLQIVDPGNNLVFDVHQYIDGRGGQTILPPVNGRYQYATVVNTLGVNGGFGPVTQWARANGKRLFLGEFGGPRDALALAEMASFLDYIRANPDVWVGATQWGSFAGGPMWGQDQNALAEPFNLDPYSSPLSVPPVQDFSGATPEDPRLTLLKSYVTPSFTVDGLGSAKILMHFNPASGNTPAQWTDTSGNNNHATQATSANQPVADAANGGLTFDVGKSMSIPTLTAAAVDPFVGNGDLVEDILTIYEGGVASGAIKPGYSLGGNGVLPRTYILPFGTYGTTGTGGSGTYAVTRKPLTNLYGKTFRTSRGASLYLVYAVVMAPTVSFSNGQRDIIQSSTQAGGLDLFLTSNGALGFNDDGLAALGPNNFNGDPHLVSGAKTLMTFCSASSGQSMIAGGNDLPEDLANCVGYGASGFTGSGTLVLGNPSASGPFTIAEVVIADGSKITTRDHLAIIGDLMARHAINPTPGAQYGYRSPLNY